MCERQNPQSTAILKRLLFIFANIVSIHYVSSLFSCKDFLIPRIYVKNMYEIDINCTYQNMSRVSSFESRRFLWRGKTRNSCRIFRKYYIEPATGFDLLRQFLDLNPAIAVLWYVKEDIQPLGVQFSSNKWHTWSPQNKYHICNYGHKHVQSAKFIEYWYILYDRPPMQFFEMVASMMQKLPLYLIFRDGHLLVTACVGSLRYRTDFSRFSYAVFVQLVMRKA